MCFTKPAGNILTFDGSPKFVAAAADAGITAKTPGLFVMMKHPDRVAIRPKGGRVALCADEETSTTLSALHIVAVEPQRSRSRSRGAKAKPVARVELSTKQGMHLKRSWSFIRMLEDFPSSCFFSRSSAV